MIDIIQNEFKKIISNFCERHSQSKGLNTEDVQLIFCLDEKANPVYKVCEKYTPVKTLTFKEVLGVKIDFKGYSMIAPPFIQKSLLRFAYSLGIDKTEVKAMAIFLDKQILLYLYNKTEYVKKIEIAELFTEEDMLSMAQ